MKKNIIVFFIFLLLISTGCQNNSLNNENLVDDFLNKIKDKNSATVVSPLPDSQYYDVLSKRVKGFKANFEWFSEYAENNVYPYPYNEKFGITEEEYNNLLNGTYMKLVENDQTDFECEKIANGLYEISIDSNSLEFTINTNENEITMATSEILSFTKEVSADKVNQHLTGLWNGYTYTSIVSPLSRDSLATYNIHDNTNDIGYENVIPELVDHVDCKLVSISIGKFADKDEYLIYYRYINTNKLETNYLLYYIE